MQTWTMKCSVCDETFELERDVLPVGEAAPQHDAVYPQKGRFAVSCAGVGQALLPARG